MVTKPGLQIVWSPCTMSVQYTGGVQYNGDVQYTGVVDSMINVREGHWESDWICMDTPSGVLNDIPPVFSMISP